MSEDSSELLSQISSLEMQVENQRGQIESQRTQITTLLATSAELEKKLSVARQELDTYQAAAEQLEKIERVSAAMTFRSATPGLTVGGRFPDFVLSYTPGPTKAVAPGLDD